MASIHSLARGSSHRASKTFDILTWASNAKAIVLKRELRLKDFTGTALVHDHFPSLDCIHSFVCNYRLRSKMSTSFFSRRRLLYVMLSEDAIISAPASVLYHSTSQSSFTFFLASGHRSRARKALTDAV